MKNGFFIISGPSGVGKGKIIEGLNKFFPVEKVVTTSTRKIRPGESEGRPYYFISEEEFKKKIEEGKFFEWAQEYNDNYYGGTYEEIERVRNCGQVGVWEIEYKGVIAAKKAIPGLKAILISAPLEDLEKRIIGRDKDKATKKFLEERMAYTREWLKHKDIYDYEVVNEEGKLDEATEKVANIIKKELEE